MTPKETAKDLFNKFSWEKTQDGYKMFQTLDETKRCALIAVNEMIEEILRIEDNKGHHISSEYWIEVKKEIEQF